MSGYANDWGRKRFPGLVSTTGAECPQGRSPRCRSGFRAAPWRCGGPDTAMSSLVLIFLAILGACALAVAAGGTRWSLSPRGLLKQCTRVFVTPVLAWVYRADAEDVERRTRAYWVGRDATPAGPASESWKRVRLQHPGLTVHGSDPLPWPRQSIPFVYEVPDRDFLRGLRARYRLDEIVGAALEEYPAMLRLGAWLGTRWDHGVDKVPGSHLLCDPIAVIAAGEQ